MPFETLLENWFHGLVNKQNVRKRESCNIKTSIWYTPSYILMYRVSYIKYEVVIVIHTCCYYDVVQAISVCDSRSKSRR